MTVHAGILGLGRWGQVLVDSIHGKSDEITISSGCTGRKQRVIEYCQEREINLHDNLTDLLSDPSINAMIIATPHGQHADQIIACAEAGKHVFVEKPFTLNKKSAERARDACASAGVVCALGHNRRFLPNLARLRQLSNEGEIGELIHVEANISAVGRDYTTNHWRSDPIQCPAGSMTGLGVHMTDALISIMGEIEQVNAEYENKNFGGIECPITFMTLRFVSGATGVFSTLFQTAPVWFIRVSGNHGWAAISQHDTLTSRKITDNEEFLERFPKTDIEFAELEAFAKAIKGVQAFPVTPDEAVHGSAVLEAVVQSVKTGQPVNI